MKKFLIAAAAVIFFQAQAQQTGNGVGDGMIRYGITAKVHSSNISNIHDRSKPRIAGSAGGFVEIPFAQRVASSSFLVAQAEYSMEGEKSEIGDSKQEFNHDYVNVMFMIKHFFSSKDANVEPKIFAFIGPKFAINVAEQTKGEIPFVSDLNAQANFKTFNFGMTLGAGYRINRNIEAFVRGDYGFSNVYDRPKSIYSTVKPKGTSPYQLGAGLNYIFN